jgi:hypothetical protein
MAFSDISMLKASTLDQRKLVFLYL